MNFQPFCLCPEDPDRTGLERCYRCQKSLSEGYVCLDCGIHLCLTCKEETLGLCDCGRFLRL
jgi:hypothetical protein